MNIPRFTAEASLRSSENHYVGRTNGNSLCHKEAIISPAFRVNCGSDTALGVTCTLLGGAAAFIPCFWNSGCMFAAAVSAFPPCATCTFVD